MQVFPEQVRLFMCSRVENHLIHFDPAPLMDVPLQQAKLVMDTNFFGFLRICNLVVPRMAASKSKGLIVAVGSILGEIGTPWKGMYNSSKAALHAYTETLEMECRPFGVNVMLVVPGSVISNIANVGVTLKLVSLCAYLTTSPADSMHTKPILNRHRIHFTSLFRLPLPMQCFSHKPENLEPCLLMFLR